jgi:hypothetical protein
LMIGRYLHNPFMDIQKEMLNGIMMYYVHQRKLLSLFFLDSEWKAIVLDT